MTDGEQITIVLGADHGGFPFLEPLIQKFENDGLTVMSVGAEKLDPEDDYPKFAFEVGKTVSALRSQGKQAYGILLCRSGAGMTIAANKIAGVRAVTATTDEQVAHARQHNDANVLSLSADWSTAEDMWRLIQQFIATPFSKDERHQRRINQIAEYESS
ncbi:MAG: ribose 5-phosphate isomerase [Patescibacteria group bacterium]|jgi:ribose 5-phosphate isomerase B|nr:ribose 5-phosphate isomerase [Patescibacteria group bacterium]